MPALLFELLNYISASLRNRIASGSVQAIRIRDAREPQESWSKARCIPCARSRDIKMLVPQHALGCRMDARERAPSPRHGAVTAALLRARALHGCARRRRKTVPSRRARSLHGCARRRRKTVPSRRPRTQPTNKMAPVKVKLVILLLTAVSSDALSPLAPVRAAKRVFLRRGGAAPTLPINSQDVTDAQKAWGDGIVEIGRIYTAK